MKRELILDRIEENIAVLTDKEGKVCECPAVLLPEDVADGAALHASFDTCGNITSLEKRTVPEEKRNCRKLSSLFAKNPKNQNK